MKILCLTSRFPYPPNRGDRLRAFHFIEHLGREHELTLLTFSGSDPDPEHVRVLKSYCRDVRVLRTGPIRSAAAVLLNVWRRQPLQALYYRSRAMRRLVEETLARDQYDAAYVHLFRMAPYLAAHPELYRIVDLTDVISKEIGLSLSYRGIVSRLVYGVERPRVERYERWVAQTFEETWLISEADRRSLASHSPEANIRVIPNGVDTDCLHPIGGTLSSKSLIFVGHMRVFHNVDAATHLAQDILPLLRQQIPDVTLTLVGANPASQVEALARAPAVEVTGFVDDLNAYLNRAAVFVAPLRFAAGVQNKVLEAMAAGRPVVTTSLVNDGLGAQPERQLLIADDTAETVRQVTRLLQDEELRLQLGTAARAFVQERYSWEHAVRRVAEIEAAL